MRVERVKVLVVTLMLFTLGSLLLSACGDSSPAATSAAGSATTVAGGGTTAAGGATTAAGGGNAATTQDGIKLNPNVSGDVEMWHFWSSSVRRNGVKRVIALCKKQLPNINVKDVVKPFGDIWTANVAAVAAGSGMPDVIVEDRPQLPQAAANNVESDLQDRATRDGLTGTQFWPFAWQQTKYNDHTYGIPYETDVRVLFYNKNAFKEAGLDPEKPPKTWDDLKQYADKLDKKKDDGTIERMAFNPFLNANWDLWAFTNGADIAKDGKVNLTDPKIIETMQWMKTWVDRYGGWSNYLKFKGGLAAPPQDGFMSGKLAMFVDTSGYASQLNFYAPSYTNKDGKKEKLDWGVAEIPYKTTPASSSGGFALSIPKGAKNADAAWEFIKCATGPEAQTSWARDTYSIPGNQKAAQDGTLLADPAWAIMVGAMKTTKPIKGDFVKGYSNWGEQVDKRTDDVWQGKTDPQQAMADAQKTIDAEIAKNK